MSKGTIVEREAVHAYVAALPGVVSVEAWGETSYFYNPGHALPRGTYFATIKDHDGANDRASKLDRPGIWRLNMGVSKPAYFERFGPTPPRPGKGRVIEGDWDFTATDVLTPHPIYGWMSWIAVLSPTAVTWRNTCVPLLTDAHARAIATFGRRVR